jgi:hypothetical protein
VNVVITKGPDGELQVKQEPTKALTEEMKQIIEEMK